MSAPGWVADVELVSRETPCCFPVVVGVALGTGVIEDLLMFTGSTVGGSHARRAATEVAPST